MDLTQPSTDDEENEGEALHLREKEIRETSPLPDPLPEEATTPLPSSHVNATIHPQSRRPPNRPLDSPAGRTRSAVRKLPVEEVESQLEENENVDCEEVHTKEPSPKKTRGRTKMQTIAMEPEMKLDIRYNGYGQPIGETSVGLSSFLGTLVREVVPVNVETWKKISTRQKEILWHSIQARYNVDEWQKKFLFQKMGGLWRASKSRLVSKIGEASNDEELNKLKPDNISSMHDWNDFIKHKTSATFKAKSKKFKDMKQKQLPHTCSRRGYARLAEDLKKSSSTPITRVDVWTKAHVKKDGTPMNSQVADTLDRIEQNRVASSSSIIDDAISRVLGPDQTYVRGLGFGVTLSKVSTSIQKDKTITSLEKKCDNLTSDVDELKSVVASLLKDKEKTSDDNSNHLVKRVPSSTHIRTPTPTPIINSPPSVTTNTPHKCLLLDWIGSGEVIAEGRWSSNDPSVLVHHVPLGPNAVRVWVDTVKIPNSFLWRPTSDIIVIDDALGTTVAWPMDKVKLCD
ncbi:Plant transposase [Cucumis melo var. makuwa]|uniref:Plant transposase n=1 Tax=Cucumis melo var. makuwa TaxID=1194695 RepID=A0A5A7SRN7_CUCMM|nr:Plant transposase [Cucumis melo var. makuwa]